MKNLAIARGSNLLKALGNNNRLAIVTLLRDKELNVTELQRLIGLGQSALSQHLAILRNTDIVKTRRVAQTIFYSLNSDKAIQVIDLVNKLYK